MRNANIHPSVPTSLGRRTAMLGAAVTAAGAGTTAPAIAATPHPDAELLAECAAFDAVERSLQAIPDDEAAFTVAYEASKESQDAALRRICEIPASTLEGLRARVSSARLWNSERDYHPEFEAGGILIFEESIWRDLGGRPHALQHDAPYVSNNGDGTPIA